MAFRIAPQDTSYSSLVMRSARKASLRRLIMLSIVGWKEPVKDWFIAGDGRVPIGSRGGGSHVQTLRQPEPEPGPNPYANPPNEERGGGVYE